MEDVFIMAGARTPVGSFGGSLKDTPPGDLATHVSKAALEKSGLAAALIGHVVFGQVIQTEPKDAYLARVAGIQAGLPVETPAVTLNRLCGTGIQAVISAAQGIMLGDYGCAIAGGAENMSRAPHLVQGARWGQRMGDAAMIDTLTGALTDPFNRILMGVTAENVAKRHGVTRAMQDALALESQKRAAHAIAQGYFKSQIAPVSIKKKGQMVAFDTDEYVRADASLSELEALKPIFDKSAEGSVTAGNASGVNDGAAAVVLVNAKTVKEHNLKPLARIIAYGHAGVDPAYMGIGPVPATRHALARAGLTVKDLDVIESNEAFAAQACAVSRELEFDPAKVNPNGSGISIGHPVGATGAINIVKLAYELQRTAKRYGLATMCIGGGQGIALIIERA